MAVSNLNFVPSSSTPLTLTWQTVTGTVVYQIPNLPLAVNNVIWPGTVINGFAGPVLPSNPTPGSVIGWPGWDTDVDGNWFEVPTGLRPQLLLVASVNPLDSQTLNYPMSTQTCSAAPRSSLGDFVWNDSNGNGVQDSGEPGVDGVTVNLYQVLDQTPAQIATMPTAGGGQYLFPNLVPGDYFVEFLPPQGVVITAPGQGGDPALDSNPDRTTGRTPIIELMEGENNLTIDAGVYSPSIALKKYTNGEDADAVTGPSILVNTPVTWTYYITNTGSVSLTNVGLSDDVIGLIQCPQSVLPAGASMLCQAVGNAQVGQYANLGTVTGYPPLSETPIGATDPSHYIGYDPDPTIVVKKSASQTALPWPGGMVTFTVVVTNTSINDVVTLTELTDSIYGNLVGKGTCTMPQTLQLGAAYTCEFAEIVTIPEDNDGNFTHRNVVTARGNGVQSEPVDGDGEISITVPCENGGTISGLVWHDANGNNMVDPGESPFISDPTLPADQRIELPIMVEENDPTRPVAERTTVVVTKNGQFNMTGLRVGATYTFRVADEPLQGMGFLPVTSGLSFGVETHSCAPTVIQKGYDSGIVGMVGDFHWYDVNRDGKQNEWQDANGNGRIDESTGQFSLGSMEFVDLNGNGLADLEGELIKCGINSTGVDGSGKSVGPVVNLVTSAEATNRTSIVGSTGYYRFAYDGLDNPLSATGSYTVTRNPQDAKTLESARDYARRGACQPIANASNKEIVVGAAGAADATVSAGQAAVAPIPGPTACGETTANSASTNLTDKPNHIDLTLDFAIVCVGADQLAGLGDRVWLDNNRNGIQDVGEPGVAGVVVNLYVNGDLTSPIRTAVTDVQGNYSFRDLIPTSYVVEFVVPDGRAFTLWEVGNDYSISSDADPLNGRTTVITLAPGQYDPTWDAGIQGDPTPDDPTDEPIGGLNNSLFLPAVVR